MNLLPMFRNLRKVKVEKFSVDQEETIRPEMGSVGRRVKPGEIKMEITDEEQESWG